MISMKNQKTIATLLAVLALLLITAAAFAQQDPVYGLYLNNPLVINPAYTGLNNNLEATVGYRSQWGGFDGSPTTTSATGHVALRDNRMGLGLIIVQDNIGENKNTGISGSYAYKLKLSNERVLSFGMQAGFINYKTDPSQVKVQNPDDPAFAAISEMKFNLGAGMIYKTDRFFAGLSIPRLVNNGVEAAGQNITVYQKHYYLLTSYLFYMSERIILKPAVLLKALASAPVSADVNVNVNIDRKYTAGIYTRNLNAFGVLAQINFLEKFRLAYALEIPSNKSVGARFTTNEVQLGIRTSVFSFHNNSWTGF
jgi:type IX secretion system PorP/SprF family membrane protein